MLHSGFHWNDPFLNCGGQWWTVCALLTPDWHAGVEARCGGRGNKVRGDSLGAWMLFE